MARAKQTARNTGKSGMKPVKKTPAAKKLKVAKTNKNTTNAKKSAATTAATGTK